MNGQILVIPGGMEALGFTTDSLQEIDDGIGEIPLDTLELGVYVPDDPSIPATLGFVTEDAEFISEADFLNISGDDDDALELSGDFDADDGIGISRSTRMRWARKARNAGRQIQRVAGNVAKIIGRTAASAILPGAGAQLFDEGMRAGRQIGRQVMREVRASRRRSGSRSAPQSAPVVVYEERSPQPVLEVSPPAPQSRDELPVVVLDEIPTEQSYESLPPREDEQPIEGYDEFE